MKRSSSSGSQSDSTDSSPPTRRRQRHGTSTLADKVKGQHAGELLLDLHSIKKKRFSNCSEYYMPGMIVDGTGVSITMLVISRSHYEKIERNEPLDPEDKAQIYVIPIFNIREVTFVSLETKKEYFEYLKTKDKTKEWRAEVTYSKECNFLSKDRRKDGNGKASLLININFHVKLR
ncbi:unnamed protein product [Mytilus edulis]|uniref:Uncharacterized protein n=1 Tax=Mytilus edulis TaxID=6550 RepID=A0A8S3T6R3_MYTED|nr:unnamed protein product [Mytilus edulis]